MAISSRLSIVSYSISILQYERERDIRLDSAGFNTLPPLPVFSHVNFRKSFSAAPLLFYATTALLLSRTAPRAETQQQQQQQQQQPADNYLSLRRAD